MAKDNQQFLAIRPRRMRKDEFSRRLMRENVLTTNDLAFMRQPDPGVELARVFASPASGCSA